MKKELKVIELFERTLNNCKFYEKENNNTKLLNEIGCLRGIAYVMTEVYYMCPHTEEFLHFIEVQNKLNNTLNN